MNFKCAPPLFSIPLLALYSRDSQLRPRKRSNTSAPTEVFNDYTQPRTATPTWQPTRGFTALLISASNDPLRFKRNNKQVRLRRLEKVWGGVLG
ncbi:unnamed protein product [Ectocarpus sp. CCAP 1310/34]|nr:unnamed protein product [Ectocarpus sp. CCAP 1310/34]